MGPGQQTSGHVVEPPLSRALLRRAMVRFAIRRGLSLGGQGAVLASAAVGVVVARHQPRNPVGWILILFVVLFLIPVDAGYYAALRYHFGYHGLPLGPAAIVLTSLWPIAFALFPLVILLFPDGRLTSRRWPGRSDATSRSTPPARSATPTTWRRFSER